MKHQLLFILYLLIITTTVSAELVSGPTELRIGVVAPLSGSSSGYGEQIVAHLELFKQRINNDSNLSVKFILEDGRCGEGNAAALAANKLINIDRVHAIISACSGETLLVGPMASPKQIFTFAVLSNHSEVSNLGPYVYRVFFSSSQGIGLLRDMLGSNVQRVALLVEENPFTEDFGRLIRDKLKGRIAYDASFSPTQRELRDLVLQAKQNKPQALVFFAVSGSAAVALLKEVQYLQWQIPIYSSPTIECHDLLTFSKAFRGAVHFFGVPQATRLLPAYESHLNQFRQKYPQKNYFEPLNVSMWNAVQILTDCARTVGTQTESLRRCFDTYNAPGAVGPISFDKRGDLKGLAYVPKLLQAETVQEIGLSEP